MTRDPELRPVGETQVCQFGLAVSHRVKDKDVTDFFEFEAWDRGGEVIAEHFHKGQPILVHCTPRNDRWEDAEGKKRSKVYFRVDRFEFLPFNAPKKDTVNVAA